LDEAIDLYEKALALRPKEYYILWKLAEMLQMYGQTLGEDAKERKIALWEKGVQYGKMAVKVNPNGKEGHFYYMANMGALAQIKGAFNSAWNFLKIKKEMDKTLELDPQFAPALVARAQYLTELPGILGGKDEKEAMQLYKQALEADPRYLLPYYYMAQLDARHRRYDEAIAKLKKIIDCKEPAHYANWVTQERPWAERFLKEILREKEKAQ
jgi:tetratricopeptide (TPR) repeat protein